MLRAGQSTYKIADGSVLGINDYYAVPTLFKGLFLTHSSENIGLDIALIQNESVKDIFVVSVDARSFPDLVKTANFHLIVKDVAKKMGLRDDRIVLGNEAPGSQSLLNADAEAASEGKTETEGGGKKGFTWVQL